ncbi:Stk1 family PASTA domain-containing Ser/Thr kinase [Paenibacillus turpanensis]|uniref:Stk1 family PASTA domain-containing Ser/Thr kinase n=1 Tax=Paenibacillus turpanensis TaxID=2689078 RepID=UPI001FB7C3DB|nr:Stk1 family PASTA domain-containing Ser/Thr kinase [Paenibacillus turpanensis]
MIGQELSGRYEIMARIGGGGMALVYKGHDILLHRKVAIKVLRPQFVHDEEFIRRFRREAQAAASLSHPNVVSIYDVGQEGDTHYIVMEYIEGHNLNEIIQERAPLQVEEAVHIAAQIADALDHAHHNQIIHRDIKPHNILIGKNGRVKVTDFGIARAATSSTITQTGSVVGSVHYFSPEHAKGVNTGAKSDLYSLGIVLYQMLTAKLPFLGESPISVALKHLQENVEEPRKVNPLIPQSVENIILKAMRKMPEERYQSANEMLKDLESCLSPERRNEPKIRFGDHDGDDMEATLVMPAIRTQDGKFAEWKGLEKEPRKDPQSSGTAAVAEEPVRRRMNPWVKTLIWFGVIAAILGGMWIGVQALFKEVPDVVVPSVVNMSLDDARKKLEAEGLVVDEPIIEMYQKDVQKGIVYQQEKEGMTVKVNSPVKLWVSKGTMLSVMEDYKGRVYNDVVAELTAGGLDSAQLEKVEEHSDEPAGTVIQQTPAAGTEFDPAKVSMKFTVSKGREMLEMPNLIGKTEKEAISEATRLNLKLPAENIIRDKAYYPKGQVYEQWPYRPKEPVPAGDTIKIWVSDGLPDEAVESKVDVTVPPSAQDKETSIRIVVTDAMGDKVEWGTRKITKSQKFPIGVVTSPTKDAVIEIYRDGEKWNQYTWTHRDAQKATAQPVNGTPSGANGGQSGGGSTSGGSGDKPPASGGAAGAGQTSGSGGQN